MIARPDATRSNGVQKQQTVIDHCTRAICGTPNRRLFEVVIWEMLSYFNRPGLSAQQVKDDFNQVSGNFEGDCYEMFGLDQTTPCALAELNPVDWVEIFQAANYDLNIFYNLFQCMLIRFIKQHGECLCTFICPGGTPVDQAYFSIIDPQQTVSYVKVNSGLPLDIQKDTVFIFPTFGEYRISPAHPRVDFVDPGIVYPPDDLEFSSRHETRITIHPGKRIQHIGCVTNALHVNCDPDYPRLSIHPQRRDGYPVGFPDNRAFINQTDLELPATRGILKPDGMSSVTFSDLPPGTFKIAGYSKEGIIITTVNKVQVDINGFTEVGFTRTFELGQLEHSPPPCAMLQGDIIPQRQPDTHSSGPYALTHAAGYWYPLAFNPKRLNGRWLTEHIGSITLLPEAAPDTWPDNLICAAGTLGFSSEAQEYAIGEVLVKLKQWIFAGVPVIVRVGASVGGASNAGSQIEHYKLLVGYDDNGGISDGQEGRLYFVNSEVREDLPADHIPIGNDTDTYADFLEKRWAENDFWCLPIYPDRWDIIKSWDLI